MVVYIYLYIYGMTNGGGPVLPRKTRRPILKSSLAKLIQTDGTIDHDK